VKITKETPEGDLHITTLVEGEIFGEMSLFDGEPRSATVTSFGRSRILTLDRKMFFSNISRDPTITFKILQSLTDRLRRLMAAYSELKVQKFEIMNIAVDPEEICRTILQETRDMVDADNGSIMLLEKDSDTLRIIAAFGEETPEKLSMTLGEGIAGKVLETGNAQVINNVAVNPLFKVGGVAIHSILCVPLLMEDEKLGVLNLSTSKTKLFNEQDLRYVQSLAAYSTMAIKSSMHCHEMKKAAEALTNVMEELEN
jgi:CRP-like cAMP-binding protein